MRYIIGNAAIREEKTLEYRTREHQRLRLSRSECPYGPLELMRILSNPEPGEVVCLFLTSAVNVKSYESAKGFLPHPRTILAISRTLRPKTAQASVLEAYWSPDAAALLAKRLRELDER